MSALKVTGKIIAINQTEQVTDTFKKREFVVEFADNPQYPETILFQLIQDKCEIIDSYKLNDSVSVDFNLKGRKWTSPKGEVKYFNTLQVWRINKAEQQQSELQQQTHSASTTIDNAQNDLPF